MPLGGKKQSGVLDGTPEKRLFWSIISDYDTKTALCELVDNAVDRWLSSHVEDSLQVNVTLDVDRQGITVEDNAGGVAEQDLRLLVAPGGSNNDPDAEMIGVFGVGSKRAAVALAEVVVIRTRQGSGTPFEIEINKDWLEDPDWDMPLYEVSSAPESSTRVSMTVLRQPLTADDVPDLLAHFGAVYATFLETGRFELKVNGQVVPAVRLDSWAFPRGHEPRRYQFQVDIPAKGAVLVSVIGGLVRDRLPSEENYGVCFYCNGRLIAKHVKDRECGYHAGAAGVPHPDASLARVIVTLDGPARLMPWNSSKTAVNYSHNVFKETQQLVVQLLTHYSSLSRRLRANWEKEVFRHSKGDIVNEDVDDYVAGRPVHLPELPRVQRRRGEHLVARNRAIIAEQPWTLGLVEAVAAADFLSHQRFETRNRHVLILLDSTFEIALKEFIVHQEHLFPKSKFGTEQLVKLFADRNAVIAAVDSKVKITPALLNRVSHYYGLRNKLIHERATVDVLDSDIRNFRLAIQQILQILFKIDVTA